MYIRSINTLTNMKKIVSILFIVIPFNLMAQMVVGNQWEKAENVLSQKYKIKIYDTYTKQFSNSSDFDYRNSSYDAAKQSIKPGSTYSYVLERNAYGEEKFFRLERSPAMKLIAFDGYLVVVSDEKWDDNDPLSVTVHRVMELGKFRTLDFYKKQCFDYFNLMVETTANQKDMAAKKAAEEKAKFEAAENARKLANSTKNLKVKAIKAQAPAQIQVGTEGQLGVIATTVDGKELKTEGLGGQVDFDFGYTVKAPEGVTMSKDGTFKITAVERVVGDILVFEITDKFQPELKSSVKIPVNYAKSETLNFYAGANGSNGVIPFTQDGCKGLKGRTGENGGNGQSSSDLDIYIEEAKNAINGSTYYKVRINKPGQTKSFYYSIAKGSRITVQITGGNGGKGSQGGDGSSISNACNWMKTGDIGQGGNGGDGGNGGNANIILSNSSINYLEILTIDNRAGSGGSSGYGLPKGNEGRNGTRGSVTTSIVNGLKAFSK